MLSLESIEAFLLSDYYVGRFKSRAFRLAPTLDGSVVSLGLRLADAVTVDGHDGLALGADKTSRAETASYAIWTGKRSSTLAYTDHARRSHGLPARQPSASCSPRAR